jgi:electron transfer flavoprotein beta subunit
MSSHDEYALETALLIKDNCSHVRVDVITVGAQTPSKILKRALGMGADHSVLCTIQESSFSDSSLHTASMIASYVRDRVYSLVLAGAASDDQMHGQVGPMLATLLDWPYATNVASIEYVTDNELIVQTEAQRGLRYRLGMELPAVLTVLSGNNKPRYPSLSNMLRARKSDPEIFEPDTESILQPMEQVCRYEYPTNRRNGQVLNGTAEEKASELLRVLALRGLV